MDDPLIFYINGDSRLRTLCWLKEFQIDHRFEGSNLIFSNPSDAVLFAQEFMPEENRRIQKTHENIIQMGKLIWNELTGMMSIEVDRQNLSISKKSRPK